MKNALRITVCVVWLVSALANAAHAQNQKKMMKIGNEVVSVQTGQLFNRAQQLISTNQFDQAATILKSLVDSEPNSPSVRFKYGFVLVQLGKNEQALEQAKKCVELSPRFVGGWTILGEASLNLKLVPQAKEAYQKALSLDPHGENADVIKERLQEIANPPEAQGPELVEDPKSAEENRKIAKLNQAMEICNKATALSKESKFEEGLQQARAALKIAPDADQIKEYVAIYLNNYAANCTQSKKLDQAETLMKESLAIQIQGGVSRSTRITTLKNYSALLMYLNRPDEAKKFQAEMTAIGTSK